MSDIGRDILDRLLGNFPGMAYRCLHDADWTLQFVSVGTEDLIGFTPAQLVDERVVAIADLIHPDDLAGVSLAVERAVSRREPFACQYRMRRADGQYIWVAEVGRGVFADNGDLEALEGFVSDATSRVEAEQSVLQMQRRDAVAQMTSAIAHDFNNALTTIVGCAALLRAELGDRPRLLEELGALERSADMAARLTRDLVAFGAPSAPSTPPLDLVGAIRAMEGSLRAALSRRHRLVVELPDAPVVVPFDRTALEQVLVNLALNARDAMEDPGELRVSLRAGPDDVELIVADTGPGVDPDLEERVFEPYFTTKARGDGTGIGLATVRQIVERASGTISLAEGQERGASFAIRLKLAESQVAVGAQGGTEVVLIADDNEQVRRVFGRALRRLGYTVLDAADGRQALQISGRHKGPIDLVIADANMPHVSGIELVTRLRAERPDLVAVLLSGGHLDVPAGLFHEEALKPVAPDELGALVRRVLDARST